MLNYYPAVRIPGLDKAGLLAYLKEYGLSGEGNMDQSKLSQAAQHRPDTETARIVDLGVAMFKTHGREHAAAYLRENGVSVNTVARVLCEPQRRRGAMPFNQLPFHYLR